MKLLLLGVTAVAVIVATSMLVTVTHDLLSAVALTLDAAPRAAGY